MKVVRTIHPVGQGAFYTERFVLDNDREVNIVYDCGAQSKRVVNKEIRSYFAPMMHKIDILFLSHFDNDHVNGIEELLKRQVMIKCVIVPRYDNSFLKAIVLANNVLYKLFSSATKVIQVNPIKRDSKMAEPLDIESIDKYIDSQTPIALSKFIPMWVFVPLYFGENEIQNRLFNEFTKRFRNRFFDLNDPQIINEHKKEINDAYYSVYCRNVYSMMLYSGLYKDEESYVTKVYHKSSLLGNDKLRPNRNNHEACLYTGDANIDNLRIKDTETYLGNKLINRIGLLQIPHHGSIHSVDMKNLSQLSICQKSATLFASFGINSPYNHPSLRIVEDSMINDFQFIGIDEQRENAYIEEIIIK